MTIECREICLFGLLSNTRVVEPESQETLDKISLTTQKGKVIGRSIIVESPDNVIVRYHGIGVTFDEQYHEEEILIENYPSFKDTFLGRRRIYYWKPE